MDTFFVSASEICLFQGRKSTVENYFRLQFSQVIVQLFLVKIEKVTPALAWKILTEGGTFFYPVFKMNALMFQDKRIYPQQELKSGQYFMFGAHLFKFENEAIWKCKILGTQEIVTAYALSSGLMPVDLRLVKVLYLNKVLRKTLSKSFICRCLMMNILNSGTLKAEFAVHWSLGIKNFLAERSIVIMTKFGWLK